MVSKHFEVISKHFEAVSKHFEIISKQDGNSLLAENDLLTNSVIGSIFLVANAETTHSYSFYIPDRRTGLCRHLRVCRR